MFDLVDGQSMSGVVMEVIGERKRDNGREGRRIIYIDPYIPSSSLIHFITNDDPFCILFYLTSLIFHCKRSKKTG